MELELLWRQFDRHRVEGFARGGRPLRTPDEALEPEDEAVHLRRAKRDLHHRPRRRPRSCSATRSSSSPNLAADGRTILFVGTKRQAQDAIAEEAQRSGMFFVNQRWLGGLLTNFSTIQRSLARLRDLEAMETDGRYESLSKKEIAQIEKEKRKLQKNLEGIRHMSRLPDALFVVDTRKEKIAVDEARKLKIPVIGVVDTNCDPDEVDYVIPGNDDALRAIRLFASRIADAIVVGPRHPRIGAGRRRPPRPKATSAPGAAAPAAAGAARTGHLPGVGLDRRTVCSSTPAGSIGRRFHVRLRPSASSCQHSDAEAEAGSGQLEEFRQNGRINAALVKQLRDATGAGMMECKAALMEANGNIEDATTILRKRGLAAGDEEGRALDQRRAHRQLHSHGRQDRRARRGELRVGFRGAHRRLPEPRARDRDAHRRRQPAVRAARGRAGRRARARARRSTAARWRARTSRPRSSTRSSRES